MKTEWKICIVGLVGAAVLSTPTWLPMFGINPEWFGSSIVRFATPLAPFLTFAIGVIAGWNAKKRHAKKGGPKNESSDEWTLPLNVNPIIREHPDALGNSCSNDSTMEDGIKRIAALPDEERSALEVLAIMGVQALDLVRDMYVDTFVDTTTSWLNSVDAPGHIREIAHKSSDQPDNPNEFGERLHRYRLNEETRRVLDKFPEVFNRLKEFHSELREMASYERYSD